MKSLLIRGEKFVYGIDLDVKLRFLSPYQMQRPMQNDRGCIYLGSIPRGFEEPEMKRFFSQFGTVTRLRLSRNPKVCIYVISHHFYFTSTIYSDWS